MAALTPHFGRARFSYITKGDALERVYISSGYFNMTKAYERMILASPTAFDILTAAPEVDRGSAS